MFSLGSLTARGNRTALAAAEAAAEERCSASSAGARRSAAGKPYVFTGYRYFVDPEGYQANAYPWGTLNAVDMNTGKYLWTVPFGEHTELAEKGLTKTGAGSHGGMVLTPPACCLRVVRSTTSSFERSTAPRARSCGPVSCPVMVSPRRRPTRSTASSMS